LDSLPPVCAEAFIEALRDQFEAVCRGVAAAVNQAPTGQVINASEEKVRDLFADFRRAAYQTALQMKIQAAEAAFSPDGPPDRQAPGEQGPCRVQRPDGQ
jgi:hypothetical protein